MIERFDNRFPNLPNRPGANPIQRPIENPMKKPIENPIQKPIEKPITKPIEKPIMKPIEKPIMKPIEKPITKPIEKPIMKPIEKPIQKPIENPIKKPIENPITKPIESPATCPPYTRPGSNKKPPADPALIKIMQYQFAVYDISLYLDTHPNDARALAARKKYASELHEMRMAYEEKHGPMNLFSHHGDYAKYVNEPWPWDLRFEGGKK